jgi:dTDP-4-amino-4,6-dideoxygalactose transaminase
MYCNEISLPVFYDMTEQQVQMVIHAVVESTEEVLKHAIV